MTKEKKAAEPKAYTAPHPVYTAGIFTPPGEVFVTNAPKGDSWDEKTPAEAHIIEASTEKVPGDPPITEKLGVPALSAIAITKNVNPDGLSARQLVAAIKAANEPAL